MQATSTAIRPVCPRWLENPLDGEGRLLQAAREHAPIGVIQGLAAGRLQPADLLWKGYWMLGGRPLVDGVDPILRNPRLLAAAADLFGGSLAIPVDVVVNLSPPMRAGFPHVDTPSFRGLDNRQTPAWFIEAMLVSGRFERWRVKVAGALMWAYAGVGGEFEYWPNGPDAPSSKVSMPAGERALVADNDVMFHRVRDVGRPASFQTVSTISPHTEIWPAEDGGWIVTERGATVAAYRPEEIRVSMLWRARVYADEREASIAADGSDDLTIEHATALLAEDMAQRGIAPPVRSEGLHDPEWRRLVESACRWGPPSCPPTDRRRPPGRRPRV